MTPEQRRAYKKAWDARNPDKLKGYQRKYYESLPASRKKKKWESLKLHAKNNPEYQKEWYERNKTKCTEKAIRRRITKLNLTHLEIDLSVVRSLFDEAKEKTLLTGVVHDVDHIIPLAKGGWHHHLNLQVLPSPINKAKHDDHLWEMEGYKNWRDVPKFLWPEKLVEEYTNNEKQTSIAT